MHDMKPTVVFCMVAALASAAPAEVVPSTEYGETSIGKGLDKDGAALFWVRAYGGSKPHHELYRTRDGARQWQMESADGCLTWTRKAGL